MSEEEIALNASEDNDALFLTDAELSGFKRVTPTPSIDVKKIRKNLHMSQKDFSQYFGFNLKTLRDWEQHRREPSGAAKNLLKLLSWSLKWFKGYYPQGRYLIFASGCKFRSTKPINEFISLIRAY
ncbi:helix-turn-helix domain-containing protein [Legionella fairfieldensis]|uniref:helix-turn-helix domain-containing protein n=1 Tax=Legionella fairfieldensis TaxID=45064 RepID=UPI001A9487E8|nr:hypothetical protein [Legionella fairfieldensis]